MPCEASRHTAAASWLVPRSEPLSVPPGPIKRVARVLRSWFVHALHPPPFHILHTPDDWPDCFLEARCSGCDRVTITPVRMLLRSHWRIPLIEIVTRFRCQDCGAKAAPVFLCACRTRTFQGGPEADWAIELVPTPKR